jgi:hypothetical protein
MAWHPRVPSLWELSSEVGACRVLLSTQIGTFKLKDIDKASIPYNVRGRFLFHTTPHFLTDVKVKQFIANMK